MKRIGPPSTDRRLWRTNPLPQGRSMRMSLSASWADPRDYAVEFSDLAALTYGHPDDVGRQRRVGEALTYDAKKFIRVRAEHAGGRLLGGCLSELDSESSRVGRRQQ